MDACLVLSATSRSPPRAPLDGCMATFLGDWFYVQCIIFFLQVSSPYFCEDFTCFQNWFLKKKKQNPIFNKLKLFDFFKFLFSDPRSIQSIFNKFLLSFFFYYAPSLFFFMFKQFLIFLVIWINFIFSKIMEFPSNFYDPY